MTLISDLVRPQLCMMLGRSAPARGGRGPHLTLQLDILHSLRYMLLTARRLLYWNVSSSEYPLVSTHLIHCGDCHHDCVQGGAGLGWEYDAMTWV